MYLGQSGSRFRIIANKGQRRISCPIGTQEESRGRLGTGQEYVWCFRTATPPPAPAAPRITVTTTPITTVSPATQVAVSPQISPTLAQQQASPGAAVTGAPKQTAGGQSAETKGYTPGMTAAQLNLVFDAERRAREDREKARVAEAGLDRAQRQKELDAFKKIYADQRAREASALERENVDRAAREAAIAMADTEAQAAARESAPALPPPSSMIPLAPPMTTPPTPAPSGPPGAPGEPQAAKKGTPWGMILLALSAVGIVAAGSAKKRKGKR